jgi:hypothetical protein
MGVAAWINGSEWWEKRESTALGFKESLQHPPDEEALHAVTEA